MMKIKFRAKRKDNGEWVEGYYFKFENKTYITYLDETIVHATYIEEPSIIDFDMRAFEVDPETVCQYTGLKDKNGTKIYEEDICKTKFFGKDSRKGQNFSDYDTFKITYKDGIFLLENRKRQFSAQYIPDMVGDGIKVIGNVWDNPELLED